MTTVTVRPPASGTAVSGTELARAIDVEGSGCIDSFVTPDWLANARSYAESLATGDGHELMLENIDGVANARFVHELLADGRVLDLLESVSCAGRPASDPLDRHVDVSLRVVDGPDPANKPMWFHYDGTVVTMVVPIVIPNAGRGQSGELMLCPNRRPFRKFVTTNVIEKLVVQSNVYRRRFLRRFPLERNGAMVPLQPGNAYFFWGYRSYHTTMPCAPGHRRVTLILHYKDVHSGSRLLKVAKSANERLHR